LFEWALRICNKGVIMAITDKFNKIKDGTVRPLPTFLTAQKTNGATSMQLDDTTGWEDSTAVHGILYRIDSNGDRIPGSQIDWKGTISGTTVSNLQITAGTDDIYEVGSVVELAATAGWGQDVVEGILVHANQDGTLKNNAATLNTLDRTTPYGLLANTEYFTSSGTWTKPANLKYVIVEVQGGGGSGGGATATSSSQVKFGSGGSAGNYAKKKILATALGSTETVTVGSGGAASTTSNDGGESSFGTHCNALGGKGGESITGTTTVGRFNNAAQPDLTGGGGSGDFVVIGGAGLGGMSDPTGNNNICRGGSGGNAFIGQGGGTRAANGAGFAGRLGGGGSGAAITASTGASNGGAGGDGIVIVHEYF